MKVSNLNAQEILNGGFTHKFIITHEDLTTTVDNTAQAITLFTLAAGQVIGRVATRLVTAFSGGVATLTASVGDDSAVTTHLAAQTVMSGTGLRITDTDVCYTAANTLKINFVPDASGAVYETTVGEYHVYAQIVDLTKL